MREVEGVEAVEDGRGFAVDLSGCEEEGGGWWCWRVGDGVVPVAWRWEDGTDVDGGGDAEGVGVDFVAEFAGEG